MKSVRCLLTGAFLVKSLAVDLSSGQAWMWEETRDVGPCVVCFVCSVWVCLTRAPMHALSEGLTLLGPFFDRLHTFRCSTLRRCCD